MTKPTGFLIYFQTWKEMLPWWRDFIHFIASCWPFFDEEGRIVAYSFIYFYQTMYCKAAWGNLTLKGESEREREKIDRTSMSTSVLLSTADVCMEKRKAFLMRKECIVPSNIYTKKEREKKERERSSTAKSKEETERRRRRAGMLSNCLSRGCITMTDFVITLLLW